MNANLVKREGVLDVCVYVRGKKGGGGGGGNLANMLKNPVALFSHNAEVLHLYSS